MKLVIENLRKSFDRKEVLKKINFEFEEGKIYGLLGRNGVGKTTLFNCLNEDIEISDGQFYLEDQSKRKKLWYEEVNEPIWYEQAHPKHHYALQHRCFIQSYYYLILNETNLLIELS